jgi:hypothetical protein
MEAACNVCMVNEWDQLMVGAALEITITLPEVYIDLDGVLDRWHFESLFLDNRVGFTRCL